MFDPCRKKEQKQQINMSNNDDPGNIINGST